MYVLDVHEWGRVMRAVETMKVPGWQKMDKVKQFCYLGDVLDCEAGVERAV